MRTASSGLPLARRSLTGLLGLVLLGATALAAVPAHAAANGTLSGTVTGPSGQLLTGITVSVYRREPGGVRVVDSAQTANGGYTIPGLDVDDQYQLGFYDTAGTYAFEYWDDKSTLESAREFTVAEVPVANAELALGRHITGTVAGPNGAPLKDVEVSAYPSLATAGERLLVDYDMTDAEGRYDIGGLPAGDYRIGFKSDDYAVEYWDDKPDLESATNIAARPQGSAADNNAVLALPARPIEPPATPTTPTTPTTTAPAGPAAATAIRNTQVPSMSGVTRVRSKLRAGTGGWSPGAVTLSYQWLANGVPVKGATRPTFKLTAALIGKRVSVQVTASAAGYTPASVTTRPSKKIKAAKPRGRS